MPYDDHESSINEILVGQRRPGHDSYGGGYDLERKSAIEMCVDRDSYQHQKNEGRWHEYVPNSQEIEEAVLAQKAWRAILRHGRLDRLDPLE